MPEECSCGNTLKAYTDYTCDGCGESNGAYGIYADQDSKWECGCGGDMLYSTGYECDECWKTYDEIYKKLDAESTCSCGCNIGACQCKKGCGCGCNHAKGGADWAAESFESDRDGPDTVKSLSSDWEPCVVCWELIGPNDVDGRVNEYGFPHHEHCIVTDEIMNSLYDEQEAFAACGKKHYSKAAEEFGAEDAEKEIWKTAKVVGLTILVAGMAYIWSHKKDGE